MRRPSPWVLLLLVVTLLPLAASEPAEASHVPASRITRSFYMGNASRDDAVLLGCRQGDKNGRMILFFGSPVPVRGAYGATLWGAPNRKIAEIRELVKDFARGYVFCRRSSSYRLQIGIGTSNSTIDGRSNTWLREHGRLWARRVREAANWANRHYPNAVQVYAAWDAEPSWSAPGKANAWMHGYDFAYPSRRALYANFSADGCPTASATNGWCNNGWRQANVWHLGWQHDPSLPIPQIYATSGVNARQWQLIDEWATHNRNDGIYFFGAGSQRGACRQVGGCAGTDNTPHRAHDFLLWYLNSHIHTWQRSVDTMTDMHWHM